MENPLEVIQERDWSLTGPTRKRVTKGIAMSNLLFQTIDQISREKGIDPQIVIHAIEDAIVVASRKYFKSNEELRAASIRTPEKSTSTPCAKSSRTSQIPFERSRSMKRVRIKPDAKMDEEIEFLKPTVGLGRIAAQTRKAGDLSKGS
jgi:N utilization substance protein A